MNYFDVELEMAESPDKVRRNLLSRWTSELGDEGYALTSQSDIAVTYNRQYRSWPVILGAIIFFPIGLFFLLIKSHAAITATIDSDEDSGNTIVTVNGQAPRYLRKYFEKLPGRIE